MGGGGSKTEGISGSYHHTKVISKSPMVKQSATFNIVCNKHEKKEGEEYGEGGINQKTGTFTYSYVYEQVISLHIRSLSRCSLSRFAKGIRPSMQAVELGNVMYSSRGAKLFSLGIQKRQKRRGMLL
jgi:hypothetical protein